MKLTSVEMYPDGIYSTNYFVLNFKDPRGTEQYNVKSIQGLDAEDIVPQYYGSGGAADNFYNLSLQSRTIVVKVGLRPITAAGDTYSSLRDSIYKAIASSRTGLMKLVFKNGDERIAAITGFVTKVEAPQFEKNQEIQITINCSDPLLRAENPFSVPLSNVDPALTAIGDDKSTAPHGMNFTFLCTGTAPHFKMFDPLAPSSWFFEISGPISSLGLFVAGDLLVVSTDYGRRAAHVVRGVNTINMADRIVAGSSWPIMFPGENFFGLDYPDKFSWQAISYYQTYWGV